MGASIGRLGGIRCGWGLSSLVFRRSLSDLTQSHQLIRYGGKGGHPLSVDEKLMSVASRLNQWSIIQ